MNTLTIDRYIDFCHTVGTMVGIITATLIVAIAMSCIGWHRFACHFHRNLPYWMAEAKETYLDWEYKVRFYAPIVLRAIDNGFQFALSLR